MVMKLLGVLVVVMELVVVVLVVVMELFVGVMVVVMELVVGVVVETSEIEPHVSILVAFPDSVKWSGHICNVSHVSVVSLVPASHQLLVSVKKFM